MFTNLHRRKNTATRRYKEYLIVPFDQSDSPFDQSDSPFDQSDLPFDHSEVEYPTKSASRNPNPIKNEMISK